MTYKLVVKPEAELDILESAKWYENQQKGLGIRFVNSIDKKILNILENPLKYQVRYKETRFALVKRFPFSIHFLVEEDKIQILAVLSTHRNPQIWK